MRYIKKVKTKLVTISQPGKPDINFVVGARPSQFTETTKKKLDRQRPSKKAAQLVKNVAKAKVTVNY
jgi:hypothetical protein